MNAMEVEIRVWGSHDRYCIFDDEGWFLDEQGQARTYSRPSGATTFLRRTGYPWIVKMPSGRTIYVNCDNPALGERFGPHSWHKKNAITIIDKSGAYDIWRCGLCNKEEKRYGLAGRPPGGTCRKNPLAPRQN